MSNDILNRRLFWLIIYLIHIYKYEDLYQSCFTKLLSKISVYRNTKEISVIPANRDLCELDAKEGDKIEIRLKTLDMFSTKVATINCQEDKHIYYVGPTMLLKCWETLSFKLLPYFTILFLAIKPLVNSESYDWFCSSMIVMTALSLIILQFGMAIPAVQKKLFKVEKIDK